MSNLPDAERDACDVAQSLGGLAALLSRLQPGDPAFDDTLRVLRSLADEGSAGAQRVVAYLQSLRGAGDGATAAVPPHLAPWRDWVPPRGHLLGGRDATRKMSELPRRRRTDPGE
ncbi:hypothetical protein [Actinoplanes sp. NPDC049265]|uniref:hypothetical protein n=1 Tax=Actinoplanes sp. NPDC049265 TaxID=3363902 RepID=UPI003722D1A4